MSKARRKPQGKRTPRPVFVPQIIVGHDIVDSARQGFANILRFFIDASVVVPRQQLADINMLWQQLSKVHERTGSATPSRADIHRAHNIMERLNANGAISADEVKHVQTTMNQIVTQVKHTPREVWHDVELTLRIKEQLHGATGECWMGGALARRTA